MRGVALALLSLVASCGAVACGGRGCGEPACPEGAVLIPPGTFTMGSDEPFDISAHSPAHQVTLTKAYCIDRTEVTMEAMAACVRKSRCKYFNDTVVEMAGFHPKWPVDFINWQEADAYCRAQGGRLPTDAEWEYAARGSDGRIYPWGSEPPTGEHWRVQPQGDIPATTTDVGAHPKGRSFFGLEDMAGNVKEWVADYCHQFRAGAVVDPQGPTSSAENCRVKRGSGWSAPNSGWARATMRLLDSWPSDRDDQTGFRCAYDPR